MADQVLSHTLYLAIGIIAMLMIVSSVYGMQNNMHEIDTEVKLNYIASLVENKILELEKLDVDEARVKIDGDYLVNFENNKILVSDSDIEVVREVDMEISGEAMLPAYLKLSNGKIEIAEQAITTGIIIPIPIEKEVLR